MFLLPSVLARKRMWNPKYPVCIRLAGGSNSREDEGGGSEPSSSSERDPDPPATLYLFGRTGREKEEWFRHFLFASMDGEGEAGRSGTRWMCVGVWLMGYMLRFSASLRRHAMASGKEKCECLKPESFAFHLPTQISLHRASNTHQMLPVSSQVSPRRHRAAPSRAAGWAAAKTTTPPPQRLRSPASPRLRSARAPVAPGASPRRTTPATWPVSWLQRRGPPPGVLQPAARSRVPR